MSSPVGEGNSPNGNPDKLKIRFESSEEEGASDGSNGDYKREPARYDYPEWDLGWTDGRLGQPIETNEAILRAHYQLEWLNEVRLAESSLSRNKAKANQLQDSLDRIQEKLKFAQAHFEELWHKRLRGYYEFSYALALIYLVVALVLFLSDVPLSLRLVAKGFDLKTQVVDPVTNTVVLSVDDLIKKPWPVFSNLWEPIILALGIALAGVFVKFFLDEVIFREESEEERPRKVRVTLGIVLVVFLLTIGMLGMFRANIQRDLQRSEFQIQKRSLETRLIAQGLPVDQRNQIIQSLPQPVEESTLAIVTFIALTITLPVIGGVCFSAGWRRLKNARHYKEVKRELKRIEVQQAVDQASFNEVVAAIQAQERWLEHQERERSQGNPESDLYVNLYRHGYHRGTNVPETIESGENLFTRSQRAVEKILAKRLRKRIWQDVD